MATPARIERDEPGYGSDRAWETTQHAAETRDRLHRMKISGTRAEEVLWLASALYHEGYILPADQAVGVAGAVFTRQVLMLSGVPGCGKTYLAECLNRVFCPGMPLLKVEGHEEVTLESLLYSIDETSLRLYLETAPKIAAAHHETNWFALAEEARSRFVHYGPVIESIVDGRDNHRRRVLLLDELDKFKGSQEAFLLSFLNDYSVSLPHLDLYFSPRPHEEPIVVVTKNESRQIMQPTQRRCVVFPVTTPTILDEDEILTQKTKRLHPMCRYFLLLLVTRMRNESIGLAKPVSISETVDVAEYVEHYAPEEMTLEFVDTFVPYLAKNAADQAALRRSIRTCYDWAAGKLEASGGDEARAWAVISDVNRMQLDARRKHEGDIRLA